MKPLAWFDRTVAVIERVWILVCVLMLLVIMIASTADVGVRYVFNSPLGTLSDLISLYLMPGAFFSSCPTPCAATSMSASISCTPG